MQPSQSATQENPQKLIRSQVFNVTTITFLGQFASYSIASIFILFLTLPIVKDGLGMTESDAYEFMGVTQAMGYLMPIVGGFIIDRYLGIRRGITWGVSLLAVAYGLVYLGSSYVHVFGTHSFIIAYAMIPTINALTSSPTSALVSRIYKGDEVGSKSGMTYYYIAINVGSLIGIGIAPLLMDSALGVMSVIAVVMIGKALAALNFIVKRRLYDNVVDELDKAPMTLKRWLPVLAYCGIGYAITYMAYLNPHVSTYIIGLGCSLGILTFCARTLMLDGTDRVKQLVATFLILVAIVFFVLYNQMATTMVMFTKNNTDNTLLGLTLAPAQFQMINPLIILLIGSMLPKFYQRFSGFTIPYQFAVGVMLAGLSMLALWLGAVSADSNGMTSGNYVGLSYFIVTIAELFVSAVGLSMIGLYCHSSMLAFAMGAWYLASSMSNLITGQLGKLVAIPQGGEDTVASMHAYGDYFYSMGWVALVIGGLLFGVMYLLQRSLRHRGIEVC
ncbi:peptide MFS transporter [Paraferrimonas haliotis]|uniref:IraAB n=1 Tax=Paraferrimonas haliotis TaxID=2013866 RepID=A0AA37WZ67_9GAMM|nr:oligopeptide:H+ symporter [Paraferrimonas haliotis]GLS83676.1 IraAB [Paraferrimonas haliotis]